MVISGLGLDSSTGLVSWFRFLSLLAHPLCLFRFSIIPLILFVGVARYQPGATSLRFHFHSDEAKERRGFLISFAQTYECLNVDLWAGRREFGLTVSKQVEFKHVPEQACLTSRHITSVTWTLFFVESLPLPCLVVKYERKTRSGAKVERESVNFFA